MNMQHISKYIDFITSGYDSDKPRFWEVRGFWKDGKKKIMFFTDFNCFLHF